MVELCKIAGVRESIDFIRDGAYANIWARYPVTEYEKVRALSKSGRPTAIPILLDHLYYLSVTNPKDLGPEPTKTQRKIEQIVTFFQKSLQETFGFLASDVPGFTIRDFKLHMDTLCERAPSEPEIRVIDPLAEPKALLASKVRLCFSYEHFLAGDHLRNIFLYMDWLTSALSIDEAIELPPNEVYEWLRNLIGGLDKSFEELFFAAIKLTGERVDPALLASHDNMEKIAWLKLRLSDEEIALIEKINIGNALQYTNRTEDAVDPTAVKPYALLLRDSLEFATSYVGVESDYCVKKGGKDVDFSAFKFNQKEILADARRAVDLWSRLAEALFPTA